MAAKRRKGRKKSYNVQGVELTKDAYEAFTERWRVANAPRRRGRRSGVKNLIYTNTGVKNRFGVEFTHDEVADFQRQVKLMNDYALRYQREMLARRLNIQAGATDIPERLFSQKSAGINRFKTRQGFEKVRDYYKFLYDPETGVSKQRVRLFQIEYDTWIKAFEHEFGELKGQFEYDEVLRMYKKLSPEQTRRYFVTGELSHVGFTYYGDATKHEKMHVFYSQLVRLTRDND